MEIHTQVLGITAETGEWTNQSSLDGLGFLFVWLGVFFMIHIFDHLKKIHQYLCLAKIRSYCSNGYLLWKRFFHHLNGKAWLVHTFCLSFHRILQYPPHFFEVQLLIISSKWQSDHGDTSFGNFNRISKPHFQWDLICWFKLHLCLNLYKSLKLCCCSFKES